MIIFGTRGVTYKAGDGDFYCPSCRNDFAYKHKRVRRFFTLYFIPIIPLDMLGEYVECAQCRSSYRLDILDMNLRDGDAHFDAEYHRAVKQVMIQMMIADGQIDDSEIEVIKTIYEKITEVQLSDEEVEEAVAEAHANPQDVATALAPIAPALNEHGKELVLKAALMVAGADGNIDESEKQLIAHIAGAMQMSEAHFAGVMRSLSEPAA